MVESSSSVYANMTNAEAFFKVRHNIQIGCGWFKDTHYQNTLVGWMSPYTTGKEIPDARMVNCDNYICLWTQLFDSCNNVDGSHAVLNLHRRLRSGQYSSAASHSIWFRIPLSLRNQSCVAGQAFSYSTCGCLPCVRGLFKDSDGALPCTPCPVGFTTVGEGSTSCSVFVSPPPPVTTGLVGYYTADSWNNSQWTDASGTGNHVIEVGGSGSIAVARPAGAAAYVHGPSTAWMQFPAGILPSAQYTLFFVARYNGNKRGRILQGLNKDWFSGFWNGRSGVSLHDACGFITPTSDLHGNDWVLGSDRSNSFRSNVVDRTISNGCQAFDTLSINTGFRGEESSDFAIHSILVYNVKLSDADVHQVESFLTKNRSCAAGETFSFSTFSCLPCGKGFYKNSFGALPCTPCPIGSTTACEGSLSIAYCSVFSPPVLPVWSTARLSQARFYLVATSVRGLALFAGGDSNCTSLVPGNRLLIVALGR
jgi:hypothetical protein